MRLYGSLEQTGDRIALIDEQGNETTYRELHAAAEEFAARIGTTRRLVFLEALNTRESIVAYVACLLGDHPVYLFQQQDQQLLQRLTECYNPNLYIVAHEGAMRLDWHHEAEIPLHPDLRVLLSTSGSTGSPKFVKLSEVNVLSNARSIAQYLEIVPDDRAITSLKFSYSYGMSVINSSLASGASLLLTDRSVTDREFWRIFKLRSATSFAGVPHTFETLARMHGQLEELPGLRYATQAGGRLAPELVQHFARLSARHGWRFYVMYGQTEAAPRIAYLPPEKAEAYPRSIGQAIPGGEIRILDPEGHAISEPGQPGELCYSGPNVMMGYAEDTSGLASAEPRSMLRTGDLAQWNEAGLVEIVGRATRFVKPFGLRVNLDDVEAEARRIAPSAACTGNDELIVIALAEEERASGETIVQTLSQIYKLPAFCFRTPAFSAIPRLASGKTDYRTILEAALDHAGAPQAGAAPDLVAAPRSILSSRARADLILSRNQVATLLVSGLWHGAAWTFVSWGLFHGIMLVLQRQVGRRIKALFRHSSVMDAVWVPVQILSVFILVAVSRVLFRSADFTTAMTVYRKIVEGPYNWRALDGKATLAILGLVIVGTTACEAFVEFGLWRRLIARRRALRAGIAIAVLLLTLLLGEFLGGRFIYVQF